MGLELPHNYKSPYKNRLNLSASWDGPRVQQRKSHVNLDKCCLGNGIKQIRHDKHNVYGDQVRDGKRDKHANNRQQLRANLP